jgi:hypothetical protein
MEKWLHWGNEEVVAFGGNGEIVAFGGQGEVIALGRNGELIESRGVSEVIATRTRRASASEVHFGRLPVCFASSHEYYSLTSSQLFCGQAQARCTRQLDLHLTEPHPQCTSGERHSLCGGSYSDSIVTLVIEPRQIVTMGGLACARYSAARRGPARVPMMNGKRAVIVHSNCSR